MIKSEIGRRRTVKSQSAMEYLMTYGWAILIIAVILAAFFELGVFNPYTFAAKAQPGSCQVYRPDGAGTNNFISLQGTCNGEIPEYAAQFNGGNSYISIQTTDFPLGTKNRTVSLWVYEDNLASRHYVFDYNASPNIQTCFGIDLNIFNPGDFGVDYCGSAVISSATLKQGVWYNLVETLSGNDVFNFSVDGSSVGGGTDSGFIGENTANPGWIGAGYAAINILPGQIANVQIYNTALSQSNIESLYKEGIGGVPIDLNNLVGWYPLNGNANDYSGNGNNGNAIGVTFTSGWYKGYSAP